MAMFKCYLKLPVYHGQWQSVGNSPTFWILYKNDGPFPRSFRDTVSLNWQPHSGPGLGWNCSQKWTMTCITPEKWWDGTFMSWGILIWGFHKWGIPKIVTFTYWNILLKWMIWKYPHLRNPPYVSNKLQILQAPRVGSCKSLLHMPHIWMNASQDTTETPEVFRH